VNPLLASNRMMQITEETAILISSLRHDPRAKIIYCPLPLGSIYFSDEMPSGLSPGRPGDFLQVIRVFGIRVKIWTGVQLSNEDLATWEDAHKRFPHWPVFARLELTPEQREAHESATRDFEGAFEFLNGCTE
jgi:hypothetical protein